MKLATDMVFAMNLTFCENYWDNTKLKSEFIRFLSRIHRLDLSLWDHMGFWDWLYRPFSFFDGNTLVSNVCVYSMDMTILGQKRRIAQISAVGTLAEYRRRGLNAELTQKALDWARDSHDFFFLFADEDAYQFYKRCGFRLADEYKARLSVVGRSPRPGIAKLDMTRAEHVELVYGLANNREAVSDILGVFNEKLFMFWCLYFLRDHIYYIAALDVLVAFKREGSLITLFDIVGARIPVFAEVYPYICDHSDESVEFLFMVDKLRLENFQYVKVEGNGTHLLGRFPLEHTQFIFPYTAHA